MYLVMFALWMAVGLVAGWLAGIVMKQGGYGQREDILIGLVGSLVGGIVWTLAISPAAGMIPVAGVAFVGAAILIVLQRKIWPAIA
jgi:uncharacterized membrane protein YeaQ/YmgE (transglycosylase-associated protein family)